MTSKAEKAGTADKQLKTQRIATRQQSTASVANSTASLANNSGGDDASSRHHTTASAAKSSSRGDVSGAPSHQHSSANKANSSGLVGAGSPRQHNMEASSGSNGEASVANWPVDVAALASEISKRVADMMDDKLSALNSKLDTFVSKYEQDSQRLAEVETRVGNAECLVSDMETRLMDAEYKVADLTLRLDEQEARSRRDNLRVFGVKSGVEGKNAVTFFETWLPQVLNIQTKKGKIRLDRCHRGLGRPKPNSPRVVVMKLHNSDDKSRIMAAYKAIPTLEYEGARITIRQDLPQGILQRRRKFNSICEHLISKKIKFSMRFPATLCFKYNNTDFAFDNAVEAKEMLESLQLSERDAGQEDEEDQGLEDQE